MESRAADAPHALVNPSLRALLADIVDYAGQYPPARLPLDEALHNFAEYRREPEAWMLARFVHPARKLEALSARDDHFGLDPAAGDPLEGPSPFRVSALGTGGDDAEAFLGGFNADLDAIEAFNTRHRGQALADVMEVRLPAALLGAPAGEVEEFLDAVHRRIVTAGVSELALFYEVPIDEHVPERVPILAAAMAEHNSQQDRPLRAEAGLKARCGGLEPEHFPSAEHLAFTIATCRDAGVRFKATAGLHHPMRHYDDAIGTPMHGFLNVFAGAALAWSQDLSVADLEAVLRDENADHFQFTPDGLSWRGHMAPIDDLRDARALFALSFGSCSFEEPVDDLRGLDLL